MEKSNSFFFIWTFLAFLLILLSRIYVCSAAESDFYCLKSIKDSLQDPFNNLDSWDFSNATEGIICSFSGINCWHPTETKVLGIELSNYGLIGEFPRGIRNCTSLTSLDLSGNKSYGNIPSDISVILGFVVMLDLSNNTFSGNISPDIANCALLNELRLDNNNLEGEIPSRIGSLRRLRTFSVANNYLTGAVPLFVNAQITAESFENNPELCGKPLKGCENSWLWKHNDRNSFIEAFVFGWLLLFTLVLGLFQFPSKVFNKTVSFDKWKLRAKEHLTSGSNSPGEEDLSSNSKDC